MIVELIVWVQVLGEMLPISSSTQVDLLMRWWGVSGDIIPKGFDYVLHLPLIFVLPIFFRQGWASLVVMLWGRLWRKERLLAWSTRTLLVIVGKLFGIIVCSGVLAASIELVFKHIHGLDAMRPIGLLMTAGLLFAVAQLRLRLVDGTVAWRVLCGVGAAQALALVPGISRMGITVCVALLCGMTVRRAFEFSFALQLPLVVAAALVRALPWLFTSDAAAWVTPGILIHLVGAGMVSYGVLWMAQQIFIKRWSWILALYVLGCAGMLFFS